MCLQYVKHCVCVLFDSSYRYYICLFQFLHRKTSEESAVIPVVVFSVLGFFSSPGLPSVFEAKTQMGGFTVVAKNKMFEEILEKYY